MRGIFLLYFTPVFWKQLAVLISWNIWNKEKTMFSVFHSAWRIYGVTGNATGSQNSKGHIGDTEPPRYTKCGQKMQEENTNRQKQTDKCIIAKLFLLSLSWRLSPLSPGWAVVYQLRIHSKPCCCFYSRALKSMLLIQWGFQCHDDNHTTGLLTFNITWFYCRVKTLQVGYKVTQKLWEVQSGTLGGDCFLQLLKGHHHHGNDQSLKILSHSNYRCRSLHTIIYLSLNTHWRGSGCARI